MTVLFNIAWGVVVGAHVAVYAGACIVSVIRMKVE